MTENNQKKGGVWKIIGAIPVVVGILAGLIAIYQFIWSNPDDKPCEVEDACTIVVTDFDAEANLKDQIKNAFSRLFDTPKFKDTLGVKLIFCRLPEDNIITSTYMENFKNEIKGKPQVVVSGIYSTDNYFSLLIATPPDAISNKLKLLTKKEFILEHIKDSIIEDSLYTTGLIHLILNSFEDPDKCNKQYLDKITNEAINLIKNPIIREHVMIFNSEHNYKKGYFDDSDRAIKIAKKIEPDNISNYARSGLISDTLSKFEEAFSDYTHYITNFERSNNQLISNYKVRNFRLRMIDKSINLNDQSIFRNNFAKNRINEELKKDIEFYRQNKNDSLGTDKMIMDTEKVLEKINAYNIKVSGKVMDNFNKPIVDVKIKDHKSGDSTLTDNVGNYTIGLPYNINKLTFSKKGYKLVIKENIESTQTQNITLNHKMKEIKGKVFLGGKPIQGVLIKGYQDHFSATTNHDGYYRITVPEITTSLSGKHQGFHDQIVSLGNSSTVNFSLVPKKISGKVQNNLSKLPDALVSIRGTQSKTRTINNGFFELNVPSGSNMLDVSLRGYKSKSIPINQSTFNIILEDSLRNVTLKVFEDHNTMISNVSVYYNSQLVGTTNNLGNVIVQIPIRSVNLKFEHVSCSTRLISIPKNITNFKEGVKLNCTSNLY